MQRRTMLRLCFIFVPWHPNNEIIQCERCGKSMECKANANGKCQCNTVQLNLNETQYISENYEGCLCAGCLMELKA